MERGTMSVLRQGPEGPYYNHQCYEKGRNTSRYVPREQVSALKEDLGNFKRFEELLDEYVELMVQQSRAERQEGSKKKLRRPNSASLRSRKSSS